MNVRNMIAATVLGMATLFGSVGSACDSYYTPAVHCCSYKKVVTYDYKRVPVTKWIVAYDAYGCAHKVRKTFYKTIKIPVVHYVKVCH
jgi:hypothetical protein